MQTSHTGLFISSSLLELQNCYHLHQSSQIVHTQPQRLSGRPGLVHNRHRVGAAAAAQRWHCSVHDPCLAVTVLPPFQLCFHCCYRQAIWGLMAVPQRRSIQSSCSTAVAPPWPCPRLPSAYRQAPGPPPNAAAGSQARERGAARTTGKTPRALAGPPPPAANRRPPELQKPPLHALQLFDLSQCGDDLAPSAGKRTDLSPCRLPRRRRPNRPCCCGPH
jgi:hypothetical protein